MARGSYPEKRNSQETKKVKRSEEDRKFDPINVAESKREEWERLQKNRD